MKAYLDYNIFVAIAQKDLSISQVYERIGKQVNVFPYSAAHIQEVDNIRGSQSSHQDELIERQLACIRDVSKCQYLYEDLHSRMVTLINEDPGSVLNTIREVPFAKSAIAMFTKLVSSRQKEDFRHALGIRPEHLNNYSPDEVVMHLNAHLEKSGASMSLVEFVEKAVSFHRDGASFGLSNRIAGLMEIIDMLGYWKDKSTETAGTARLWDSSHTFFAGHCDFFVTDDKRLRNKAQVIYAILGIGTRVC